MRILLIAPPRSGSTTFSRWLSKELNLKWISEPFNNNQLNNSQLIFEFHNKNNIIAKITGNEYIHTQKDKWDLIIGLTRSNIVECSISFTKALLENKTKEEWHTQYVLTDKWILENTVEIEKNKKGINKQIENIINNLDIDIQLTYEDVYYDKIKITELYDLLKLKTLNYSYMLDNDKKYRKDNNVFIKNHVGII